MITLGSTAVTAGYFMSGKAKVKEQGPPINAASKDEEQFIQYVAPSYEIRSWFYRRLLIRPGREFLKNAQAGEQKAKH